MSTSAKKKTAKGIRYTDAQKKEVVDFASSYNAANGRGGQSKAAEKFGVSPLTVSAWLVASGAQKPAKKDPKAPKAVKAPKAPKAAKAAKSKTDSRVGTRYTPEQKQEVTDFVSDYNATNGRGGQSKASAKFGISPLTVMAWLKASGAPKPGKKIKGDKPAKATKASKAPKAPKAAAATHVATGGGFSAKLSALDSLYKQIARAEAELVSLKGKFVTLKASI